MKKKFLAVALAATMVAGSVFSVSAAQTKVENQELAADSYTEMENPLKGKNAETVTITYTINWKDDAPRNGWDGIFSFYDASTATRVSFQTAPYLCYNAKDATGTEDWVDVKADAWCTANCEPGQDYTFTYVITKDDITVSCNGTKIDEFAQVGVGDAFTGYQEVLDALNTLPTLTIGVGIAQSAYWNTEPCTLNLTIDDGLGGGDNVVKPDPTKKDDTKADDDNKSTAGGGSDDGTTAAGTTGNGTAAQTGDTATAAAFALVLLAAAGAVVVLKKKNVTE